MLSRRLGLSGPDFGDKSSEDLGEFAVCHKQRRLDENSPAIEKAFAPVGCNCHVLVCLGAGNLTSRAGFRLTDRKL
jgi:hypothetical protein